MTAIQLLLAIILSTIDPAQVRAYREAGHPDVAYAYRHAGDAYREAIPRALAEVDPNGEHPEWALELWRICKREAWCGRFERVTVHEVDGWVGPSSYLWAVHRGLLDPERCEEHRLADYAPVLRALGEWEGERGEKRPDVRSRIEALPSGKYSARDFATRGGFGQNAARNLHRLGKCTSPTALDEPLNAARVAARTFAACKVWDGAPGQRFERHCTCVEHTAGWVGRGTWETRTLFALEGKSRYRSIALQCGQAEAVSYVFDRVLAHLAMVVSSIYEAT